MKKSHIVKSTVLALCAGALLLTGTAHAGEIKISLAASLKDAVTELTDTYTKTHPGVTFQKNAASSGSLAKQLANGAPADIFLSANKKWMEYLQEEGVIKAANTDVFTYNGLVFVGNQTLPVKGMKDLLSLNKIGIGSPASVPAGQYAMDALTNAGLDKQLKNKLVMAKDVRVCLMYAERGEVDGSFVYASDTTAMTDKIKILFTVPENFASTITYPMGLTGTGVKNSDAKAFFEFLKTKEAKEILAKYGFIVK